MYFALENASEFSFKANEKHVNQHIDPNDSVQWCVVCKRLKEELTKSWLVCKRHITGPDHWDLCAGFNMLLTPFPTCEAGVLWEVGYQDK